MYKFCKQKSLFSLASIILFGGFGDLLCQNLIPNYSFEGYTACPSFASQLNLAQPWVNPNSGTPEYFNGCADFNTGVSVPKQPTGGFQEAQSGQAYAGIFTYRNDANNIREYIQAPLFDPLEAGECYYFEMFVNMPNDHRYAGNRIGVYFSNGGLNSAGVQYFDVEPHIENDPSVIFSDTARWVRVEGYFTALGGEDHITIGNFRSDDETQIVDFNPTAWYNTSSYLLIDNVSLIKASFQASLDDAYYCDINEVTLDVTQVDSRYTWQDGSVLPTFKVTESGVYSVEITRGSCVASLQAEILLLYHPEPNLQDTTICLGYELKIEPGGPEGQYIWSSGSTERTLSTDSEGLYWVEVSNECGLARDSMELSTYDCGCEVFLPSAFTPNQDALNDDLYIAVDCPKMVDFRFMVFNRGGELIYETTDPFIRWDGTYSGRDCPPGVYTYTLSYYSINEGQLIQEDFSGSVQLVR